MNFRLVRFVNSGNPWFRRGGYLNNGTSTGVFAFLNEPGNAWQNDGFRVVRIYYDRA